MLFRNPTVDSRDCSAQQLCGRMLGYGDRNFIAPSSFPEMILRQCIFHYFGETSFPSKPSNLLVISAQHVEKLAN